MCVRLALRRSSGFPKEVSNNNQQPMNASRAADDDLQLQLALEASRAPTTEADVIVQRFDALHFSITNPQVLVHYRCVCSQARTHTQMHAKQSIAMISKTQVLHDF